ncbi:PREDICTED: prostaglandin E2 receptor EP1 subtype-like [Poecilia mexicana]|uniref:Thromboxane A2 receptor n=1 Tax=Poecilia mexicana TaxID=48701 RepID=A0A3B3X931_9TELE|nr:PREDICTED: prostaglandin E2 receptor EP1 subtype-like [Poecilia mexicana]
MEVKPDSNSSGFNSNVNSSTMAPEVDCPYNSVPSNPIIASLTMTLGILFNVVALIILIKAYTRFRRRSKATFLLFASSLVVTDLTGHVVSGGLVLRRYSTANLTSLDGPRDPDSPCQFLGGCLVFFGLCPLFLGCAMAAERCLGVTKPLLHARLVTTARTKIALSMIWFLALCVALLPVFQLGDYTYQYPGTWCFIKVMDTNAKDLTFVMLFSGLALSSLGLAFICNTISGMTLIRARLKKNSCSQRFSARSHDTEMVVQLVGIMVTSCICWSPLLVFSLMSAARSYIKPSLGEELTCTYSKLMMTGVRMATFNQILDPWVYILLRRAILRKIYRITKKQASFKGSTFRSVRWDVSSLQKPDSMPVKKT